MSNDPVLSARSASTSRGPASHQPGHGSVESCRQCKGQKAGRRHGLVFKLEAAWRKAKQEHPWSNLGWETEAVNERTEPGGVVVTSQ